MLRREGRVLAHGLRFNPDEPTEDMPAALREILHMYASRPRYANRMVGKAVKPLLRSVRHQESPFNDTAPYYRYADGTLSTTRSLSGCVATCLEQVMSHWRHPEALVDTLHGWTTKHYEIADVLPGTPLDWENVLPVYGEHWTTEQAKAVADVTYYCGVAVRMNWTPTSSGASLARALGPLLSAFDYKTVAFARRSQYSPSAWNRLLRSELENGRPICYTGHNMALSGHAFNIDGVDEQGYYHVNWGYGGAYDGYFDLDYLNPFEWLADPTELGQREGFFSNQTALFMHPDEVVMELGDTLTRANALQGVRVDGVIFRRPPDVQGYVLADFQLTNTTSDSLNFTFEALTYLPTDTAIFRQADYVALSSISLAPGESKEHAVYCRFMEPGERIFAISADDETLPFQIPLTIGEGTIPDLTFGEVTSAQTYYADTLTATFTLDIANRATAGYAGNLVTYCLAPEGGGDDLRHWEVLSLEGGGTASSSVTFRGLQDGQAYTFVVRCPWQIQQTYTFTASREYATNGVGKLKNVVVITPCYDLQGRLLSEPLRTGLYIKNGEKVWISR